MPSLPRAGAGDGRTVTHVSADRGDPGGRSHRDRTRGRRRGGRPVRRLALADPQPHRHPHRVPAVQTRRGVTQPRPRTPPPQITALCRPLRSRTRSDCAAASPARPPAAQRAPANCGTPPRVRLERTLVVANEVLGKLAGTGRHRRTRRHAGRRRPRDMRPPAGAWIGSQRLQAVPLNDLHICLV